MTPDQFTQTFDLSREEPTYNDGPVAMSSIKSTKGDKKKGKVKLSYPHTYMYEAPEGLVSALKELGAADKDGFVMALVKIKPTRTTETTILDKDTGATEEECSLEFEIHSMSLPETSGKNDSESELEDSIKGAAKKAGILDESGEDPEEEATETTDEEDAEDEME